MHPHLNAVLVRRQRTNCPCGARAPRPNMLCCKCQNTALWLRHTRHAKRADRAVRHLARHGARHAPGILALVLLFLGARP